MPPTLTPSELAGYTKLFADVRSRSCMLVRTVSHASTCAQVSQGQPTIPAGTAAKFLRKSTLPDTVLHSVLKIRMLVCYSLNLRIDSIPKTDLTFRLAKSLILFLHLTTDLGSV
jgi:hypothetical protein